MSIELQNKNIELMKTLTQKSSNKMNLEDRDSLEKNRFVDCIFRSENKTKKKNKMYYLSENLIDQVKEMAKELEISENEFIEKGLKYIFNQLNYNR